MKCVFISLLLASLLASCTYRPKEKRLAKFKSEGDEILESFYKKTSDTIQFKRIVSNGRALKLQSGQILASDYGLIHQAFISTDNLTTSDNILDSLRLKFKTAGFVERMGKERDVLFIQIIPDETMGTIDALRFLNLRQDVEGKIDDRLQSKNLGEWFAGDMGAGGNMLFFIDDWKKSMGTVMEVLQEEDLLDHVLLAKRIMTTEEEWSYEIVYPTEYEGVFSEL